MITEMNLNENKFAKEYFQHFQFFLVENQTKNYGTLKTLIVCVTKFEEEATFEKWSLHDLPR